MKEETDAGTFGLLLLLTVFSALSSSPSWIWLLPPNIDPAVLWMDLMAKNTIAPGNNLWEKKRLAEKQAEN